MTRNKQSFLPFTEYQEEWAPEHGIGNLGTPHEIICPAEGVITGITYRSAERLHSIGFICTSSLGETIIGPFGGLGGSSGEERCPHGYYIGSIHGRCFETINKLGIRCDKIGQTGKSPKRDGHGGDYGLVFDDEHYAINGRRPVQIRLSVTDSVGWQHSEIQSIQIKYGNMPVTFNCIIARIEVTEPRITAQLDGFEVIGISTGSTCAALQQQLTLQASETVTDTVGVETMEGGEYNWSNEISLTSTLGMDFGVTVEFSIGLTRTSGESNSWSRTESKSSTNGTDKSQGIVANYQGPGACVVVGFLSRYKLARNDIPVLYHFECDGVNITPEAGKISLTSNTFGFASFQDYQYTFQTEADCTSAARACVAAIRADNIISDPNMLDAQLRKCFELV